MRAANAISRKMGAHPEPDSTMNLLDLPELERLHLGELELAPPMVVLEEDLSHLRQLV